MSDLRELNRDGRGGWDFFGGSWWGWQGCGGESCAGGWRKGLWGEAVSLALMPACFGLRAARGDYYAGSAITAGLIALRWIVRTLLGDLACFGESGLLLGGQACLGESDLQGGDAEEHRGERRHAALFPHWRRTGGPPLAAPLC